MTEQKPQRVKIWWARGLALFEKLLDLLFYPCRVPLRSW